MDAAMAQHYGGLPPDAAFSSLHDDFLQDMHETVGNVNDPPQRRTPDVKHAVAHSAFNTHLHDLVLGLPLR